MDSSKRLRRDQEREERRRINDAYRRRVARAGMEAGVVYGPKIPIEPRAQPSPALQAMVALWPATLDTVKQCGAWTATATADYLAQLDAVRHPPKRVGCEKLDALARAIENDARSLASLANALTATADRRRADERARLLSRAAAAPAGLRRPGLGAPAKDLAPIRKQLMALDRCRSQSEWVTAVERIDEPAQPFQFAPEAPSERASAVAQALALTASELHVVAAAIECQAATCRAYWDR